MERGHDRVRNSVKVGEKRIKEPSSYATSYGPRHTTNTSADHSGAIASLHQSFSGLSLGPSSKGLSLLGPKDSTAGASSSASGRDRADSNASRASETSALDRFLTRCYEPSNIRLTARVSERRGQMDFVITLTVRDFGTKDWMVTRTVEEVMNFCEAIRLAGGGLKFPSPPAPEIMLSRVTKEAAMSQPPINQSNLGPLESHESTSSLASKRGVRHQKKRINSGGGMGMLRAVTSRLNLSSSSTKPKIPSKTSSTALSPQPATRVYPSVQEWFDAALEVWQRKWHSKSDEEGIAQAFERFICDPSGTSSAPIDLLTAVDFVVLVTASAPYANPSLLHNRKREATIAKAAIRLAKDYPDAITIDMLKSRVLSFAWERFESNHTMSTKDLTTGLRFVVFSHEELPIMQPIVTNQHPEQRVSISWVPHPQRSTLRMNLIENFSVPPTPKSLDHFYEVWRSFSDIVLLRVEARLRSMSLMSQDIPSVDQTF